MFPNVVYLLLNVVVLLVVLKDEGSSSPLTVTPSPDVQAQRQQQAAEKTAPSTGESKLLRKAREQRDKERRGKQVRMSVQLQTNKLREVIRGEPL